SRRRHTRSYGDWSSDVCSSDLARVIAAGAEEEYFHDAPQSRCYRIIAYSTSWCADGFASVASDKACEIADSNVPAEQPHRAVAEIGRASCRERGGRGGPPALKE